MIYRDHFQNYNKKHHKMKVLLLPIAKFNRKLVEEISQKNDLEIKYHKYLKDLCEFQQMFNEGSLDLDRIYIVFINDNQI